MNWNKLRFVAHRGLYDRIDTPENSMKAFEAAIEKGYAIELDINMTKDGYLVVFHDENLKRMTGIKSNVASLELNEIKKLKLLGSDNTIPTFEDVLMLVSGRVPLMIEVKSNEKYKELLLKLVNILKKYNGEYIVESFDPRIVYWLRKNYPNIIRGQIAGRKIVDIKSKVLRFLLENMIFNIFTKPNFISYLYTQVDKKFYNKQRKKGRMIAVWTVRDNNEYEKIKECCDMVIFEKEDTIKTRQG